MTASPTFARRIRPHIERELDRATELERQGLPDRAFAHLERAHVLGQTLTRDHVRIHWRMLRWSLRQRRPKEIVGQVVRILAAAFGTVTGRVPIGNTGGADVPLMRPMAIPPDLAALLAEAHGESGRDVES